MRRLENQAQLVKHLQAGITVGGHLAKGFHCDSLSEIVGAFQIMNVWDDSRHF